MGWKFGESRVGREVCGPPSPRMIRKCRAQALLPLTPAPDRQGSILLPALLPLTSSHIPLPQLHFQPDQWESGVILSYTMPFWHTRAREQFPCPSNWDRFVRVTRSEGHRTELLICCCNPCSQKDLSICQALHWAICTRINLQEKHSLCYKGVFGNGTNICALLLYRLTSCHHMGKIELFFVKDRWPWHSNSIIRGTKDLTRQ